LEQQVSRTKKRSRLGQSDPRQRTLDKIFNKLDIPDAGLQQQGKRNSLRESTSFSSVNQGHVSPESQLTKNRTLSVAEAAVAGALRRLGVQGSVLDQGSETINRGMDKRVCMNWL